MTKIVVRIMGGLGNQMFQYAFGRVLKENSNASLKLDISNYETSDKRSFFLGKFEVDFETASREDIENAVYLSYPVTKYIDRYFPPVAQLLNYYSERTQNSVWKRFVPVRYEFNSSIIDNKSGYFHGYWQSEKYYRPIKEKLRKIYSVSEPLSGENQQAAKRISQSNSVSVHLRRGDYVNEGYELPVSYYDNAIGEIKDVVDDPYFFVFSDDIDWARNNLTRVEKIEFVDFNGGDSPQQDIRLMRMCDHNIISNSTFSWWPAWLNENKNKSVMAPTYWYGGHSIENIDILPPSWTIVNV